jgi:hypothetical protein
VLTLSGGGTVTLLGVAASAVTPALVALVGVPPQQAAWDYMAGGA